MKQRFIMALMVISLFMAGCPNPEDPPDDNPPAGDNPANEDPAGDNSADDNSADDNPADDNPADDNPADDNPADDNPADDNPPAGDKYAKEYWGEWLRMDSAQTWYISGGSIKIGGSISSKSVSLEKQSDRVIKVTEGGREYYLYASRIANASFTGKIAGFEQVSPSISRSVAGGKGWINVVVKDLDNGSTTTVQTDSGGNFTVSNIIPGDDYEITPEAGTPVVVTPIADGADVGTITVTRGVNFKVGITGGTDGYHIYPDTALNVLCAEGWYYHLDHASYQSSSNPYYLFVLSIQNTGDTDATATTYELSFDEGLQLLSSGNSSGILGTIEPGKSKSINIRLGCSSDSITGDYAWKKIGVTITDPINSRTWNDSVSLRFFKEVVAVICDRSAQRSANGIIITPSGQTVYPYSSLGSYYRGAIIPKLTGGGYLFVFSGATADSESAYSFTFRYTVMNGDYYSSLPAGTYGISDQDGELGTDTARYEPNNTVDTATVITGGIHAYLHKNDIDYYRFHF